MSALYYTVHLLYVYNRFDFLCYALMIILYKMMITITRLYEYVQ